MGPARDDGVVDPQSHPEGGDSGGSFDPGLETAYLRRAPRDRELDPQLGAAPFDPGPDHYHERRARKQAKRRERIERKESRDERALPSEPAPVALAVDSADPTDTAAPVAEPQADAEVVELPRREPMAERFERMRVERERVELQRRAEIERERSERERAERERAERERRERRRREHAEKLRRDRETLRPPRRPAPARIDPGVKGPVRKRDRAAENRRRVSTRRRGLFWPTAKAGLAVSL